ncbi:MAG: efflux RND transporter permease subunit, partial [Alphaproteobacteria bacterium]|nr:efflux RND transporter permease subunit [Alphaproteobacteria bacterium]
MNLISQAIHRPIAVIAVVIMVIMFGWVALSRIPIQMTPDVRQPVIIVDTLWPGASPLEVEREIVNRQEDVLKGLEGIRRIESRSRTGRSDITLEFGPSQNMDRALLLVANRLDRVSGYPEESDEPTLRTSGTDDNAIAWYILTRAEGNERDMITYGDFLEDVVQERIERIPGISGVNIFGETEREMRVIVDPERLAQFRLTVEDVVSRLREENASISGGDVDEGKRRYIVRTEGDFKDVDQVYDIVLRSDTNLEDGRIARVTVRDIAIVELDYKKAVALPHKFDDRAMAFNMTREQGANVLLVMDQVDAVIADLADGALKDVGLVIENVYDETLYVKSAISLVQQNIIVGGVLAALILMLFLRSWRPTLIVSLAIPVSVIGSFVAMAALGRSLNVVSLAGIAFAVGMVVDAAIVVLENIYRLRQEGMPRSEAAHKGAAQVWPAVLVSSLTTVMVFIPILIMELEAGQLFRDIAVAISVSVILSLLVSVTVIPALANRLLVKNSADGNQMMRLPLVDGFARGFINFWQSYTLLVVRSKIGAVAIVAAITIIAGLFTVVFAPKLDYLPTGNRNFVFGFVVFPPGYNLKEVAATTERMAERTRQLWATETGPESEPGGPPKFERFMRVPFAGRAFIGGTSVDPARAAELIPVLSDAAQGEPDGVRAFPFQPSLFGRSVGGGRNIELDIRGNDLQEIYTTADNIFRRVIQVMPFPDGHKTRAIPGRTLSAPEVRVIPDRIRLADNGLSARSLGQSVDAFNDGVRVAEITIEGKRIDLTLMGPQEMVNQTQGIGALPVVTRDGRIVPVEGLADVRITSGPTEVRRADRTRTVTLQITPNAEMPLQEALELIQDKVVEPFESEGLPDGISLELTGTADKLIETWNEIVIDLLLAIIIVYLVMAVLFESFVYPVIILLTVPIAAAGGIAGLAVLNTGVNQPLDMLTMLGFVILTGIVVNNAILLVHQTLFHIREDGMRADDAIMRATQNRVRPIFMSTLTSVFGMLPLVVFPGAGSELYRGLGSVVLGGLSLSAVLTLAIVPPMMSITVGWLENRKNQNTNAD